MFRDNLRCLGLSDKNKFLPSKAEQCRKVKTLVCKRLKSPLDHQRAPSWEEESGPCRLILMTERWGFSFPQSGFLEMVNYSLFFWKFLFWKFPILRECPCLQFVLLRRRCLCDGRVSGVVNCHSVVPSFQPSRR